MLDGLAQKLSSGETPESITQKLEAFCETPEDAEVFLHDIF